MKNRFDGGEAIVEGFRKLGVDYILSSPGTEWAPVWEAMADQIHRRKEGPKLLDVWHETVRELHQISLFLFFFQKSLKSCLSQNSPISAYERAFEIELLRRRIFLLISADPLPFAQIRFFKTILQQVKFQPVEKVPASLALASGLFS